MGLNLSCFKFLHQQFLSHSVIAFSQALSSQLLLQITPSIRLYK